MTNDELKKHIAAFVRDYSIEITPHDTGKLEAIRAELGKYDINRRNLFIDLRMTHIDNV